MTPTKKRGAIWLWLGFLEVTWSLHGADAKRVRVLIVDGFSNHDWKLTTALIRGILEPTRRFTVDVSTAPPTSAGWDEWRPAFANYEVVIQTCNDINGGPACCVQCRRRSRRLCAMAAASMSGMRATTRFPTGPPTTR